MVEPNILSEQILTEREFSSKQDHSLEIFRGLAKNVQNVLSELHTRWSRKPFFNPRDLWIISETEKSSFRKELLASGRSNSDKMNYTECILRVLPWSIPLQDRLKYFRNEIDRERVQIQGSNDTNLMSGLGIFESQFRSKGTIVTIHRDRLLHDAMQQMMKFSRLQWKDRIVIRYIDSFGNEEKGIDVGGLFKDFVTDLTSNIIFNASFGLFVHSEDYLIFPNPFSHKLFNSPGRYEVDDIYCFIGKVLGKALYENITISPQFAYFFLAFMNGRYNFMNLISDFRTLDPELYKNLMFLKTYEVSHSPM
jgi:ubiquitin-protein ligase E3 C